MLLQKSWNWLFFNFQHGDWLNFEILLYLELLRQPHFCFKLQAIWLILAVENLSFMCLKNRGKINRSYTKEMGQSKCGKPQAERGMGRKEKGCHIIEINTCADVTHGSGSTWAPVHQKNKQVKVSSSSFQASPSELGHRQELLCPETANVAWKTNPQLYRPGAAWIWCGKTESKVIIVSFSVTSLLSGDAFYRLNLLWPHDTMQKDDGQN